MIPQTAAPPPGTGGVPREMDCSSGFANRTRTFNETKLAVSKMSLFCDSTLLSQHHTFRLHYGVRGVDCRSRQATAQHVRFRAPLDCRV